ncbi:hypothetical protein [Echinicola salinicaeni]|uniref:hypothetical protein n=1 Tax=Echinicola salinicaeni TaxID=2762757 RepID=UPI00164757C3|nr:hypothetical protein [Echinicola salinicaeni]
MKNLKTLLIALFLLIPMITTAQVTLEEEIQLIQAEFGLDKKKLIELYMDLPENYQTSFWMVYGQYEEERKSIARDRMIIINDYLNNFENLDETKTDELAKKTIKNDINISKLHAKYYKRFKKATSASIAAKFLQVDNYIHSSIKLSAQETLPFIDER